MTEPVFPKRLQIDFDKSDYAKLGQMKNWGQITTITGVLRRALKRYYDYLHFRQQGYKPFMRNSEGHEVELPDEAF